MVKPNCGDCTRLNLVRVSWDEMLKPTYEMVGMRVGSCQTIVAV